MGKSMREIILAFIEDYLKVCHYGSHTPNEETLQAIKDAQDGKDLTEFDSLEDLFKHLGI
jgi:hypothetical protein